MCHYYEQESFASLSDKDLVNIIGERIERNVGSYYAELDHSKISIKGQPWGGKGCARTFRYKLGCNSKTNSYYMFAKLCQKYRHLNPAELEYATLRLLYAKMPLAHYCVSRPLDFFPELNVYVMESVGKTSFKPYLLRRNSWHTSEAALENLYQIVSGCANWLKTFHEITKETESRPFDLNSFIQSFEGEYDYHKLTRFHFGKEMLRAFDRLFDDIDFVDGKLAVPCAKWHWDFTPAHVFLDNRRISVIDILGISNTPVYEDIGHFLATMSTVNSFPFYPTFDYDRANGQLCDIFIETYMAGIQQDREQFLLCTNLYKLKYLVYWFLGQHSKIKARTSVFLADLFVNYKMVPIFKKAILKTIESIYKLI